MDHDASCPPELKNQIMGEPAQKMIFSIAVRTIESWLLADPEKLSSFLGVSKKHFPDNPESLDNPKDKLIQIASKSRRKAIKEDMTPREGSGAKVGPAYSSRLMEFAQRHWRPTIAAMKCKSLERCIGKLMELKNTGKIS